MNYYINVTFNENSKNYFFSTDNPDIKIGSYVVVTTIVGTELGKVATEPLPIYQAKTTLEIKPIDRVATKSDIVKYKSNKIEAEKAKDIFKKFVNQEKLSMDLIDAFYTLDKTKILFTYVASDRVDFRNLLKLLAGALHCRIELKQVTPREKAQFIGGIGICGLPLCCTTFLKEFENISLNKAKNQMLAINTNKLTGHCGKLMCCLKYEDDAYTYYKKFYPPIGTPIKYNNEDYKVSGFNIISRIIKIENEETCEFVTLEEFKKLTKNKK